ncbi:MAG: hypothetical protein J6I40_06320 [Mailhella sp.]|nr:hypothetical protein [Mailhella sp.]
MLIHAPFFTAGTMIPFWKITPGGNPTILFNAADIPPCSRPSAAVEAMSPGHLQAEQVGFIDIDRCRLDMMGGEFCVNASRAFACLLATEGRLRQTAAEQYEGIIFSSGADHPLPVLVRRAQAGSCWHAEVCLFMQALPEQKRLCDGSARIDLPGITHIIEHDVKPDDLEAFCCSQRAANGLELNDAVGHLWLSEKDGLFSLFPVVWVRATSSLCQETACGSGTLASALFLCGKSRCRQFTIRQPSGQDLCVRLEKSSSGWNAWIGGPCRIIAKGETTLLSIDSARADQTAS